MGLGLRTSDSCVGFGLRACDSGLRAVAWSFRVQASAQFIRRCVPSGGGGPLLGDPRNQEGATFAIFIFPETDRVNGLALVSGSQQRDNYLECIGPLK